MIHRLWGIAKRTVAVWNQHQVGSLAAAVAFFAVLSLAPILVFATAAATRWLGEETSRKLTVERLQQFAGPESAELVRSVLESPWYDRFASKSLLASLPSAVLLLYGASGVFAQLRRALQQIFGKPAASSRKAALAWLLGRLVAAGGAIVGGLIFVLSLVASLLSHAASGWLSRSLGVAEESWRFASTPATLQVIFAVFIAVYAGLTRQRPPLRCLLVGALAAAMSFEAGRWAFEAYVSHSFVATAYGPASSLVAFLLWMYYTANVVLFSAVLARAIGDASREQFATES